MKNIATSFFILLSFIGLTQAQYYEESQFSGVGIPFFEVSVSRQFGTDLKTNQVIATAQIVFDDLTFVKSDTAGFEAQAEWLVAVYEDEDKLVYSKTVSRFVNVKDYELTNSRDERVLLSTELDLKPGEYNVLMRMVDLVTKKSSQRKVKLNLNDFSEKDVALSDLLFLEDVKFDSTGKLISYVPVFGNNFTVRKGYFYVYVMLFTNMKDSSASLRYTFSDETSKQDFDTLLTRPVRGPLNSYFLKVKKERFLSNHYILEVNAEVGDEQDERTRAFTFFWKTVPSNIEDIDKALRQMVYILNSDSLDKYENASLKSKQEFFKSFWKDRDPNPNTEKNELMDEYFKRVNYANQNYSGFNTQGWKTDRGRILIKFGPPDDIERHPFELSTRPYEIWRYYTLRKTFLFEDFTGFGDYRLHPEFVNVEYQ